jgi:hypothetical protein
VILEFSTEAARTVFMNRLQAEAPELRRHVKTSYSQSNVATVRTSTGMTVDQLGPYLDSSVKIFDDVEFRVLASQS